MSTISPDETKTFFGAKSSSALCSVISSATCADSCRTAPNLLGQRLLRWTFTLPQYKLDWEELHSFVLWSRFKQIKQFPFKRCFLPSSVVYNEQSSLQCSWLQYRHSVLGCWMTCTLKLMPLLFIVVVLEGHIYFL